MILLFNTVTGESAPLREALIAGDQTMVLELPADFGQSLRRAVLRSWWWMRPR